jgi:RNA polymerase sigma-70 factor (ECF subfamily)
LLDRLKVARPDASDWRRLQGIYLPLIRRWLARVPGLHDEADDLAQEVFIVVIRELPRFERRREGSFRAWLRRVTVNRARVHCRRRRPAVGLDPALGFLDRLEAPDGDLAREWDRDYDHHVFERFLAITQPDSQRTRTRLLPEDASRPRPDREGVDPHRAVIRDALPFLILRNRISLERPVGWKWTGHARDLIPEAA